MDIKYNLLDWGLSYAIKLSSAVPANVNKSDPLNNEAGKSQFHIPATIVMRNERLSSLPFFLLMLGVLEIISYLRNNARTSGTPRLDSKFQTVFVGYVFKKNKSGGNLRPIQIRN